MSTSSPRRPVGRWSVGLRPSLSASLAVRFCCFPCAWGLEPPNVEEVLTTRTVEPHTTTQQQHAMASLGRIVGALPLPLFGSVATAGAYGLSKARALPRFAGKVVPSAPASTQAPHLLPFPPVLFSRRSLLAQPNLQAGPSRSALAPFGSFGPVRPVCFRPAPTTLTSNDSNGLGRVLSC